MQQMQSTRWTASHQLTHRRSTVKLTFAIAAVAFVVIAGTTTICMSGAVTESTTEYGGVHTAIEQLFSPHLQVFR
jgi:hypothetical protein